MISLRSSLLLLGSIELALGAVAGVRLDSRASTPSNPYEKDTTPHCTWWHDYNEFMPCDELLEENLITIEQFRRWNPSITSACGGLTIGRSYCVEAAFEPEPSVSPTPTNPPNGIETPKPTQPDIVSNCNVFYLVQSGDTCAGIADSHGITIAEFLAWNPKAGSNCAGLWSEAYACVSIIGREATRTSSVPQPTSTKPPNGIQTPQPTQPNIVDNCNKFHFVEQGEDCSLIASKNGITLAQFQQWNPAAGSNCGGLWAEAYACVSIIGYEPTPTNPGNGIQTPTPTQPDIVDNCNKFYSVKPGDSCADIVTKNGITAALFLKWNPKAGSNCEGLWANAYACVSVIGYTPTPTNPGNGIKTPTPIQPGMVTNCKTFHYIELGQTCPVIQSKYKVTLANLYKWNPAVGPDCRGMWAETYICVGVL